MKASTDNVELLASIADAAGTPSYVYFEDTIRQQIASVRSLFDGLRSQLLYAMKANSHPEILRTMRDSDVGIDAVSPAELLLALRCGIPAESILYSANNMTDAEMKTAMDAGVLINFGELSRLRKFARLNPGSRVCIRINPDRGSGHHAFVVTAGKRSKFGIGLDQLDEVKELAGEQDLSIVGIHQHIGSGNLELDVFHDSMKSLLDVAQRFDGLEFVNFGGGFGIPYRPDQQAISFEHLSEIVRPDLVHFMDSQSDAFRFLIEPGRYLVGPSGVLLVSVTSIKSVGSRTFAGTNSGMNHLVRPAIYDAFHSIKNVTNSGAPKQPYYIVGNICESSDFFANDREIETIRESDVLAIMDAGAYGIAMASTYNLRAMPAEVLVRSGGEIDVIRERKEPEEFAEQVFAEAVRRGLTIPQPR